MTSDPKRLHPAAFVVHALGGLREALLPAVAALLLSGRGLSSATLIAVLAVGASAIIGWLRWSRTRYWVADGALHHRSGVLSPDQRTVPVARVTALDETHGPIQRLFGVVALHVQTAGGGTSAEIVLPAVGRAEVEALRAALGALPAAAAPDADVPSWRLERRALLVAAVTGPQVGVLLPMVAGVVGLLDQAVGEEDADALLQRLAEAPGGWWALAAALAAGVVLLSLAGAIVAFGGFAVQREPRRLRLRRGLVQRRTASVRVERVHAVRIVEGALRRPFGLCAVRLEVAGYAREPAAGRTLVPLCRRDEVAGILGRLLPELRVPAAAPGRPPRRAARRYALPPAALGGAAGVAAAAVASVAGAGAVVWAAVAAGVLAGAVLGVTRYQAAGWWLDGGVVAVRRQAVLARTTTIAASARLQHARLRRSPPQARARLRSVGFAVASGHETAVAHLDASVAAELFAALRPSAAPR